MESSMWQIVTGNSLDAYHGRIKSNLSSLEVLIRRRLSTRMQVTEISNNLESVAASRHDGPFKALGKETRASRA
jgi:hypothetical protein